MTARRGAERGRGAFGWPAAILAAAHMAACIQTVRAQGYSTAGFNTDYRTRKQTSVIPVTLHGRGIAGVNLPIGREDPYRKSMPMDYAPTDLQVLSPGLRYGNMPLYLRREAAASMERMCRDAGRLGLKLQVFSAFRDTAHQARLFAQSGGGGGVARPGRSEHLLGTTADVCNGDPRRLMSRSFIDTPEGRWLAANAAKYGWKMTVRPSAGRRSHADEPWHIRYLGSAVNAVPAPMVTLASAKGKAPAKKPSLMKRFGKIVTFGR